MGRWINGLINGLSIFSFHFIHRCIYQSTRPSLHSTILYLSSIHLYSYLYIFLSICLSIYLFILLNFYLSIYLSTNLSIYLSSIFLSIYLSIVISTYHLSIYLSICIYLSTYLSFYLSIYLSVGYFYQYGIGTPIDLQACTMYYRRASDQGNMNAQYNLGACDVMRCDDALSLPSSLSPPLTHPSSHLHFLSLLATTCLSGYYMSSTGYCYSNGIGVERKDEAVAITYYRQGR